jgi:hypothetical protein
MSFILVRSMMTIVPFVSLVVLVRPVGVVVLDVTAFIAVFIFGVAVIVMVIWASVGLVLVRLVGTVLPVIVLGNGGALIDDRSI